MKILVDICKKCISEMQLSWLFLSSLGVKYNGMLQSQHSTHIYREKKMLTTKLFEGWLRGLKPMPSDVDLQTWARIEYKKDSVYAYNYMLEHGVAPSVGVKS